MPEGLQGKSTHSDRALAGAQNFRLQTSQGPTVPLQYLYSIFSEKRVVCKPPALRRSIRLFARRNLPLLLQRVALSAPIADSAVHRDDVGISHFLQVIGS